MRKKTASRNFIIIFTVVDISLGSAEDSVPVHTIILAYLVQLAYHNLHNETSDENLSSFSWEKKRAEEKREDNKEKEGT